MVSQASISATSSRSVLETTPATAPMTPYAAGGMAAQPGSASNAARAASRRTAYAGGNAVALATSGACAGFGGGATGMASIKAQPAATSSAA